MSTVLIIIVLYNFFVKKKQFLVNVIFKKLLILIHNSRFQEASLHQEPDPPAPVRLLLPARRHAAGEGRGAVQRHRRLRPLRHHGAAHRPQPRSGEESRAVQAVNVA